MTQTSHIFPEFPAISPISQDRQGKRIGAIMQKQSKPVCQSKTANDSLRERAASALKSIQSRNPIVHMRNQELLLVLIFDLLDKLENRLRERR